MDLIPTSIILAVCVVIAAFASWRASQPAGLKPRLIPWQIIVIVAGAGALYMIVHLVNMMGVSTGPQNMPGA